MSELEIIKFYEETVEYYKRQIEWSSKQIEWLNKQIKREKYDWGYSLDGERYIKERNREYRNRKEYKANVEKYEKLLSERVA